jgi:hypothetical protein
MKKSLKYLVSNYFLIGNGMDLVHVSWTSTGCGPWWTSHHDRSWSSPELGLAAAPGHGDMSQGGEKKECATRSLIWLIPRLGRR